jgi:hypothetical protein
MDGKGGPIDIYVTHRSQETRANNWDKITHTNKTDPTEQYGKPRKIRQRVMLTTIRRRYYAEKEELVKQRVDGIKDIWKTYGLPGLKGELCALWGYYPVGNATAADIDQFLMDAGFDNITTADIEQFLNGEELKAKSAEQLEKIKYSVGGLVGDDLSTTSK